MRRAGLLSKKITSYGIGAKSIMDWFDKPRLRPLYERNKKKALLILFDEELKDKPCHPDMVQSYQCPYLQGDRDELF